MERSHYPAIDTSYDPSFAIRGLLFDRRTGYLVKLSYARAVAQDAAFLGRRRLTTEELHRAYGPALHCDPHRVADDMSQFNDLFALSEVCLLADVVQLAVDRGIAFDASALAEDVARAISHVHISGALHDAVRGDPATYLHPIEGFESLLASLRATSSASADASKVMPLSTANWTTSANKQTSLSAKRSLNWLMSSATL